MKILVLLNIAAFFALSTYSGNYNSASEINSNSNTVYNQIGNHSLSSEAFDMALRGYSDLKDSLGLKENIISVLLSFIIWV